MRASLLYIWILNFSALLILLILVAKIRLPPFRNWAWRLRIKWDLTTWVIFLSFHKTLPLVLFVNFWIFEKWLLLWVILGIVILFFIFSLKSLIFVSSISDGAWLLRSRWISLRFFWVYIILYSFIWWLIRININFNKSVLLLALLALPPSIFFFFKVLVWMVRPLIFRLMLRLASLLIFLVYWAYLTTLSFINFFFFIKFHLKRWTNLIILSQISIIFFL